ncbi:MAG: dTDP-4-dehydrorhamnose 3,5-epimerase [Gemmatimonadaceae bacterium]|nr:dTDP-4-dehydrorhamnose 3,5-epimerase [Gemmatimonadaceae bacterium]
MKVTRLAMPDVYLLEPRVFGDARGFFVATWEDDVFRADVAPVSFIQDNHSRSRQWTLRGLHFQAEHTQGKLVRCPMGRVWDVVVDVRRSSPTFGQSLGAELSDTNHHQLWIPPGFAHGFLVLSDVADLAYKVTDRYHPESERSLLWDDPALGIVWPLPAGVPPLLSPKDAAGVPLSRIDALP